MRAAVYATREQVKTALDSAETARNNRRIDRVIRSASDAVDRLTLRKFYPMLDTREFDWPDPYSYSEPWVLWLEENELAAAPTAVTSGGTAVTLSDVLTYPNTGPPFTELQMSLSSSSVWSSGVSRQRAITITGVYGYQLDEISDTTLAADVASTTTTSVTIAKSAEIGVGSLLRVGSERMNVTGRSMTTTGQTLALTMDASPATKTLQVASTTGYVEDETVMVDSERMRIEEIPSSTRLVVTRAWDGSPIASHAVGATVYAPRLLTVQRAACGTTAATHLTGAAVWVWQPPDLINQLTIDQALVYYLDQSSGLSRTVGSGDNEREAAGRQLAARQKEVQLRFRRVRDR